MRWAAGSLGFVVGLSSTASLAADDRDQGRSDSPSQEAAGVQQAREAYQLGNTLAQQHQWREALAAFERSARLRSHPATTFNIAFCERALGRYARARVRFAAALVEQQADSDLGAQRVREAEAYMAELDRRLVRVEVDLGQPDLVVAVDGAPVEQLEGVSDRLVMVVATSDTAPAVPPATRFELWLDPGSHELSAEDARGHRAVVRRSFSAGERTALELGAPPRGEPKPASMGDPRVTWGIVSLGLGAAGVIAGTVTGVAAVDKKAALDEACPEPSRCPANRQGDINSMERAARVSTVSFVVGGAAAALGGALVLWGVLDSPDGADEARIVPLVGPGTVGIRGGF